MMKVTSINFAKKCGPGLIGSILNSPSDLYQLTHEAKQAITCFMNREEPVEQKSKKALWIVLIVVAIILLVAVIQLLVTQVFSNSVDDLWDGATEQLGQPMEP